MTPTPRQREEWERKRKQALMDIIEEIDLLEYKTDCAKRERDTLEALTFEEHYFSHLTERESEK